MQEEEENVLSLNYNPFRGTLSHFLIKRLIKRLIIKRLNLLKDFIFIKRLILKDF